MTEPGLAHASFIVVNITVPSTVAAGFRTLSSVIGSISYKGQNRKNSKSSGATKIPKDKVTY